MVFNKATVWRNEKGYYWLLLIPFLVYVYFLKWRLTSIHDDDLFIYKTYAEFTTASQKINMSRAFAQFRPVRDVVLYIIMQLFKSHLHGYYVFNVLIQSINTAVFALLLNFFLRSVWMSFVLSLGLGLSRFCFYNTTQLFDGGVLEGLAMTFFLLFLFFIIRAVIRQEGGVSSRKRDLLWAIVFANLSMYTHERYIAIFPFILLMILFFPSFRQISGKFRVFASLLAVLSVVGNVAIKIYVFSLPFLHGSGNVPIEFSFWPAMKFLGMAIASCLQYDTGPEYLSGLQFYSLPAVFKTLVILSIVLFAGVAAVFVARTLASGKYVNKSLPPYFMLFIFLPFLFFLCLAPVVLQVRLELRWLQASFCVLMLIFIAAIVGLTGQHRRVRYVLCLVPAAAFLCTNYYYVEKGSQNLYYSTSASIGNAFDKAIKDSTIHLGVSNLYLWEKRRNADREGEIWWALFHGHFFEPYNHSRKNIIFVDSLSSLPAIDKRKDEIIYIDIRNYASTFAYSIADVTDQYIKDSLHGFTMPAPHEKTGSRARYNGSQKLTITAESISDFPNEGFYQNEAGIRWTNGNALIKLKGEYPAKDSLVIVMAAYMPPVCADIRPEISLTDSKGKNFEPARRKRGGDYFSYIFYFDKITPISSIHIQSGHINAFPDQRLLSFPFKMITIENKKP